MHGERCSVLILIKKQWTSCISNRADFRAREMIRDKKWHYMKHQFFTETWQSLKCVPLTEGATMWGKKWQNCKEKQNDPLFLLGDFTLLYQTRTDAVGKKKSVRMVELNSTFNQLEITDIHRLLHQTEEASHTHMEHAPRKPIPWARKHFYKLKSILII